MTTESGSAEIVGGYHDLVRADALELVPGHAGRVLDIGGGIGATSVHLKETGRADRVVVVDIVTEGFLAGVDASFSGDLNRQELFDRIATSEGKFNTILCLDVLEHLVDPWEVVRRLHGLLAPGGTMMISVPNMRHWNLVWPLFSRGSFRLADRGLLDRTHLRWFVRDTAIELATVSGLKLREVRGTLAARRWKLANALTFGLVRGLFELQYLIRVENTDRD